MTQTIHKPEPELLEPLLLEEDTSTQEQGRVSREKTIASLRLLWQHRRWLGRVLLYGMLASALLAFLIPTQYQSTARLMPPDDSSNSLAMLAAVSGRVPGLGALAGDLLGVKNNGAVFVGILRSRTVQDRLIGRFDLLELYGYNRLEDARKKLANRTDISEDRKSGIIEITVTDRNPQRVQAMAQAYVEELNRLVTEVSTSAARRERTFIEQRLHVVKQELDQAAQEFSQFASKNTAIDIKEQGRAMVEAAATLQGQLIVAQTELESLRQVYTNNNVRVRAVQARIGELRQQLRKLGGSDSAAGSAAESGEDSLYPSIRQLPLLGVTYADLYRRTKIAEVVFELLTQQYELAKVQEAKEIPTVEVLDAPVVPQKKSYPPRALFAAFGTTVAFAAGVVWILGWERWRAAEQEDPRKQLAEEVLKDLRASWSGNGSGNGSRLALWRNRIARRHTLAKQAADDQEVRPNAN